MEAPWLPTVLNILEDIPCQCPMVKHLIRDVLVDKVPQGLSSLHLTFGCSKTHLFETRVLFLSLSSGNGLTQKCITDVYQHCTQVGVQNIAISASKLANCSALFRIGLAWCTTGIYCSSSKHPNIFELMHHFYVMGYPEIFVL